MNEPDTFPGATSPCPPWCCREHRMDDHPEDQRHQGRAQVVTLEFLPSPLSGDEEARSVEVVVHADRPAGSSEDRLRIESAESSDVRLTLTAQSTRELIRVLRIVLEEISR